MKFNIYILLFLLSATITAQNTLWYQTTAQQQKNEASTLLFKTGFEDDVVLGATTGSGWKYFSGTDNSTGFTFPTDGQLGMGTSSNAIHMVSYDPDNNLYAGLDTAIGHTGESTTVLHQEIITKGTGGNHQIPWQFNNVTTNPDEFYMSYWQKLDENFVVNDPGSGYNYRTLFEYKTDNYVYGDASGARLILYGQKWNDTNRWVLRLDTAPNDESIVWEDITTAVIPKDKWFFFEIYFKWSETNTGKVWVKINGEKVCEVTNVITTQNGNKIDFLMVAQLYGYDDAMEHWVDDVEIWDTEYIYTFVDVTGVSITESATVDVDATTQLTATISPTNASCKSGKWTSSNESVATVNEYGLVTGVASGSATITFETDNGGFTDTSAITVSGATYGSNLITNGTFDSDLSSWTDTNTYWVWDSNGGDGRAYHALSDTFNPFTQYVNLETGKTYSIEFDVVIISGSMKMGHKNSAGTTVYTAYSTSGHKVLEITDYQLSQPIMFSRDVNCEFYIDNVSVKEVL